jgi:hypothetical protein
LLISDGLTSERHLQAVTTAGDITAIVPVTGVLPPGTVYLGVDAKGLAQDLQSNTYWAEGVRVRRLSKDGVLDFAWQQSAQTGFGWLSQMASDASGNLYVADTGAVSSPGCLIRRFTPAGVFSVLPVTAGVPCEPGGEAGELQGGTTLLAVRGNQLLMASPTNWRIVSTPI